MSIKNTVFVTLLLSTTAAFSQSITLEDIWKTGAFHQKSVHGLRSMNDGKHYTTLERTSEGAEIVKWNYKSGERVSTILSETRFRELTNNQEVKIEGYTFSNDEKKLMIETGVEHIYRHSSRAHFYIVDVNATSAKVVAYGEKVRNATFSPTGEHIAYIQNNNLRASNIKTGEVDEITSDGEQNKIINGYADWVYEEEFSFNRAYFWSPDGSKIAYYRFDESEVKEYNMPLFTGLYPEDYRFKYPKAGEDNSKVTIHVYDLKNDKNNAVDLGSLHEYIPRIKWTQNSDYLAVLKMPRLQNALDIVLVNTKDFTSKTVYREVSRTYIEISDDLTFFGNNKGFIWRSEKDGFFHLYSFDFDGQNAKQLTKGEWEVKSLLGLDEKSGKVFFEASKTKPYNTEVYAVPLEGGSIELLSPSEGQNRAQFTKTFDYYLLYHNSALEPTQVTLHNAKGKVIRTLEDNSDLKQKIQGLDLAKLEFFDFKTSEGVSLNGWMMKPSNFDPSQKYPVLMFVYGGPGSQTVTNSMGGNFWWHQYIAQKGYIVVSVDNRGTGARGRDFRTQTYRELGNLETKDQIEAAKWLGKQSYVDADRIGIWGWSYGGYMSSLCLSKGADVFKAAVAVAPVTNWRFYDNIYTERYMGLPQDNGDGYDDNSPINHVDEMKGSYLLVHGTGDDNVHYQNSVEMVDALIAADKQFDFAIYPERNHGIYGGNTRYHLFTKITDFITDNL